MNRDSSSSDTTASSSRGGMSRIMTLSRRTLCTVAPMALAVGRATASAATEPCRLAFLGVGNRGGQLLDAFAGHADARVVALCDADLATAKAAAARLGGEVAVEQDFRRVLDRPDIDAVVIATPDHWHAIQTIMACESGKDVYVEKPLSVTIREGRRMVDAARRTGRVVQVGLHRRSSPHLASLAERVRDGLLGHVTVGRAYRTNNMAPDGIGRGQPGDPPSTLDWNLWLGPRPWIDYRSTITPYKFRWWEPYSSQVANWGVHYFDAIRWCTGDEAPRAVCALGGRYAVDDDRTVPDTLEVIFEFPSGRLQVFGQYEASGAPALADEFELRGTLGTCLAGERGHTIQPERGGQFQDRAIRMEGEEVRVQMTNRELTALHARNFLDCIRSRERPNADVETGHRSTTMALIANIAWAVGERLTWDADEERFVGSERANELLDYEYREPWTHGA
jgi:predicted dehydrogenase